MAALARAILHRITAQKGQALPIGAAAMVVLMGMGGLAIDASRDYLLPRNLQNAADMGAFAAGKALTLTQVNAPPKSGDASVVEAHDFAGNNGEPTIYNTACDVASSTSFTTTWFDSAGPACSATSGFQTKITVNVPAVSVGGIPVPYECTGATAYHCFQVVITQQVQHLFMPAFGIPNSYLTVSAIVYATPAQNQYTMPPSYAMYLYQPVTGCVAASQQCFNESAAPSRASLSCTGKNCPTFWVDGVNATFNALNGSSLSPAADTTGVESNGDMVIQSPGSATFCDPYQQPGNGTFCPGNHLGNQGFAIASGAKLYCTKFSVGGPGTYTPCTTAGPGGAALGPVSGNETAFASASWSPSVDLTGLPSCGGLILNGDTVANSLGGTPPAGCSNANSPYQMQPGIYTYIVVNHGTYTLAPGVFDITGVAPVNTVTSSTTPANGIDHRNETSAADFDLCTGGAATSCPSLTAGVWIGHGGGYSAAAGSNGTGYSCSGGRGGGGDGGGDGHNEQDENGGGGDATVVSGSGVTFRFESGSAGFVSTSEAMTSLAGPGVGSQPATKGVPLLFDMENSSFIHLDSGGGNGNDSGNGPQQGGFTGLIYQTNTATAGGVEVDLSLANEHNQAAITGQVWAYSFTAFGGSGTLDFSGGYGTSSTPSLQVGGKAEPQIIANTSLAQAVDGSGNPITGMETLQVNYTDEWAMDAYDAYVKVNNGNPVYFSQGIWNPTPAPSAPLPPAGNNPGDANAARPDPTNPGPYTVSATNKTDWSLSIPNGSSTASTFEVSGNWTWGHEMDIANARTGNDAATVKYTFPTPAGKSVAITIFLTDGDRCGDYALVNAIYNNVGQSSGGQQTAGTVEMAG